MLDAMPAPSRPPAHPDCAIFACDAAHLPFAWVAASRLVAAEPGRRFDVAIASPDIARLPAACREGPVRLLPLDVARIPAIRHPNPRISLGTFYRHLLPRLLAGTYRALLYMDTDTWLRRPGVQGLLDRMPARVAIAAAPDFVHRHELKAPSKTRRKRSRALLGDLAGANGGYYQAGVLAIGVERHVELGIGQRVLDFAAANEALLHRHRLGDQAALNGACADLIEPLSPLWNWHNDRWMREDLVARFDPHLLHFAGDGKPWTLQDDPFVARHNGPWFAALRALDPAFAPPRRPGSLAAIEAAPRIGLAPLDAAHRAVRRWRVRRKFARPRGTPEALAHMAALIDGAVVG